MRKIAAGAKTEKLICVKDFGKIKLTHSCLPRPPKTTAVSVKSTPRVYLVLY